MRHLLDPVLAFEVDPLQVLLRPLLPLCEALELEERDRWAMVAPFTHVGGVTMLLAFLMTGASGIFVERFDESVPALLGELG